MTRFGRKVDVEKMVYRFLFSCAIGFLVGNYFSTRTYKQMGVKMADPREFSTYKHSDPDKTSEQLNVEKKYRGNLYIVGICIGRVYHSATRPYDYSGLISVASNLETRVAASQNTWMTSDGALIEVFSGNNDSNIDMPTIQLPGVMDNAYPPQKKSFSMLKYMHSSYLEKFDWFVRLDDDAYLDVEKLATLLNRINSSEPRYIGSAGFGKGRDDLIGEGENYCMGGPGMIFSRSLLRELGPHLGECLRHLYTSHEDIEVGRCVQRYTGVKCTTSWETKKIFFQNYNKGTYTKNIKDLTPKQIDSGIIFHANKEPAYQYRFHAAVLQRKISKLLKKIAQAEKDIQIVSMVNGISDDVGLNAHAQYRWEAVIRRNIYKAESQPLRQMHPTLKRVLVDDTNDFIRVLQSRVNNAYAKLKEVDFVNTYYLVNPLYSMDTISLLQCTLSSGPGSSRKTTQHVSVHHRHRFTGVVFLSEHNEICNNNCEDIFPKLAPPLKLSESTTINFLTALSERPDNFIRFLNNFENSFLTRGEKVNLIVTYFPAAIETEVATNFSHDVIEIDGVSRNFGKQAQMGNDARFISENMNRLQTTYPESRIVVITLEAGTEFSRGYGLQVAAKNVRSADEILFFCDVDLVFAPEILHHIRLNTIQNKQVYYPVFFSQYDPDVVYVEIPKPQSYFVFTELAGFWRHFSYGMVSIYASDFDKTNGFDLSIRGWGLEDIHLVNAILAAGLDVFKSTEPGQVHVFHDKSCESSLSPKQYSSCTNSRAAHYGPKTLLYYLWKSPVTNETIEEV